MTLFEEWKKLADEQTEETFDQFWEEYSAAEKKIYSDLLANPSKKTKGSFTELAEKYEARPAIFMGFLDGINTSLKKPLDLEPTKEDAEITLDIDFEKLYFNMLAADAEHLYTLAEWDSLLTEEKREDIVKAFKKSKTVVKEKTPGRNDPCSCGSGKKYKKCCGAGL